MAHFSMPKRLDCIFSVRVLEFPVLFHFLQTVWCNPCTLGDWFTILYLAVNFLSMWLSGIIAIMNSNGDSASPWNIPLWNFASAKLLPPPRCQFHFPGFHGFLDEVYDFMWYFVHFQAVYYPALWEHIICLFVVNLGHFSIRSCFFWGCADLYKVTLLCLCILCGIFSVPQGTNPRLISE